MSLFDKRIPELDPLAILPSNALFPVYEPATDTTYRVTAEQVQNLLSNPGAAWNIAGTYNLGDTVTYLGEIWISDEYDNTGNPPGPDSDFWTLEPDEAEGATSASNGLTATDNNVKLGGELIEDTVIQMVGKKLSLLGDRVQVIINDAASAFKLIFPDDTAVVKSLDCTLDQVALFNPLLGGPGELITGYVKALDNNVIVWGSFTELNGIALNGFGLLTKNGVNVDAFNTALGAGPDLQVTGVLVDTVNNKYYIIGAFEDWDGNVVDGLVRLDADGSFDATFAPANSGKPQRAAVLSNGSIVLIGAGIADGIEKLDNVGAIDAVFAGNIGAGLTGVIEEAFDIIAGPGDQVFIGGSFTELDGAPLAPPYLIVLNDDGTQDLPFDSFEAFNDSVTVVRFANAAKTKLFVSGDFTTFNGTTVPRMALLNLVDGTLDTNFNFAALLIPDIDDFNVDTAQADKAIFLTDKADIMLIDVLLGTQILRTPFVDTPLAFSYINDGVDELVYFGETGNGLQTFYPTLTERTESQVALLSTIPIRYVPVFTDADLSDEQLVPKSFVVQKFIDNISEGVYGPGAQPVANVSAIADHDQTYFRVRDQIFVRGMVEVTPTAGAALTRLYFPLNFPVNLVTQDTDLAGGATMVSTAGPAVVAAIIADIANQAAELVFWNDASVAVKRFTYWYSYKTEV